jgi:signal peptidase II
MFFTKQNLYDWDGGNEWLFSHINALKGNIYDASMILLSRTADHHNFPYYMCGLALIGLLGYFSRKMIHKGGTPQYIAAWFGVLIVLTVSYGADGLIVKSLKDHFAYPRPYTIVHNVRLLDHVRDDKEDEHHSFPSGHVSFATVMLVGLWPVLSTGVGFLGLLWLVGVCWSRMALGMHFPADIVAAFLISFFLVLILRAIIYTLMYKIFRIRC